jgi:V/A-type H+-transporting ATPase subunit I
MIVKMNKLTFLVYHKEYEAFLKDIRDLGVLHVVGKQQGVIDNAGMQENIRLSNQLKATLDRFTAINAKRGQLVVETGGTSARGLEVLQEVEALQNRKAKLNQQLQGYAKDKAALLPWGDFKPESIRALHDAGMDIRFHSCPERLYKPEWEDEYNAIVISAIASKVCFITVTKADEDVDLDVEHVKLPPYALSEVEELIATTQKALDELEDKLSGLAAKEVPSLKAAINSLRQNIELSNVLLNTESVAGDKLMLLQGWVPATKEDEVAAYLDKRQAYYEITNPTPDDDVPVLLKNHELFAWFEPICKLYMLPKYGEMDLTPFFAPFFMLFFGICLGDIGYGLLLLLFATGYRMFAKNIGPTMKPVLSLVQVLSFSTVICGLLTGGFFGFALYELNWPVMEKLKSMVSLDNNQMFRLSLILGVIQILFGMLLKVVNQTIQFGFKYAIETLGWIILFFSFIVATVLPGVMPMGGTAHLVVMGVAAVMIFLFNSPGKHILVNIGLGLWSAYNMATGLLGDILSYVRLFALGLSGGILASVFNSLAVGLAPEHIIAGPVVMALIFVIGHAINIFMNVLGALVHPMRLTFVEFFKNAGYEGGGKEYNPFKK